MKSNAKPFYKIWWFWIIVLLVVFFLAGALNQAASSETEADKSEHVEQHDHPSKSKKDDEDADYQSEEDDTDNKSEQDDDDGTSVEERSALNKAKSYSDTMHMSKKGIYDQLTSEYGEKFSADAAQYAIDTLDIDYTKNALEKAKDYLEEDMSPESIREQLTSEYGEQFTPEEADYAVKNLPK